MDLGVRPMAFAANPDGSTKWIFVQMSGFNGFAVVDFATHKEIKRIKNPDLPPGKATVPEGSDPSHGMAVTADGKTLVVCSRLNNYLYFVLAAGSEAARRRRARRQGRRLGDAHARRQDGVRRQPGDQRRLGRRRQVDEGSRADSGRLRAEAEHDGAAAIPSRGRPQGRPLRSVRYLFLAASLLCHAACSGQTDRQAYQIAAVTVFEGARLITGDGSAPIENSAFIVENDQFTRVGRRGEVQIPAGRRARRSRPARPSCRRWSISTATSATRTSPKARCRRRTTPARTWSIICSVLAYNGVGAVIGVGDLVDRSDLHGGRTNWGDVPLRVRDEIIPGAALFRTAGPGIAWPGSGAQGHPSQSGRVVSGHDGRRGARGRAGLRRDEARVHQDLGGRPRRHARRR